MTTPIYTYNYYGLIHFKAEGKKERPTIKLEKSKHLSSRAWFLRHSFFFTGGGCPTLRFYLTVESYLGQSAEQREKGDEDVF